jgi:hypothetical protein
MWHWLSDNAGTIDKLGSLGSALSALIAAFGALYVYREYRRAQYWRKGDLAAALMQKLESNDELAFACQALDWGGGPIMVPERYRPLMKRFNVPHDGVIDHSPAVLASALEPILNKETLASPQGLTYRHCFDKLFDHLENIGRLVESHQVSIKDLDGLPYWLERIASYEYPPAKRSEKEIFQPALAKFGYHKIPVLGRKLGVNDWSVYEEYCKRLPRRSKASNTWKSKFLNFFKTVRPITKTRARQLEPNPLRLVRHHHCKSSADSDPAVRCIETQDDAVLLVAREVWPGELEVAVEVAGQDLASSLRAVA